MHVWVLLAGMTLPGSVASAQGSDPSATGRFRAGPVSISPTLELRDVGVDTNVYNQSLRDPVKDFVFTVVPAFTATVGSRRTSMTLRSTTDLVYFAMQRSERSVNEDFSGSARVTLRRISPFAEAGYLNTHERVSDEIDARARRVERRGAAGVNVALTPKVSAVVRAEVSRMAFAGDARFDDHWLAQELDRGIRTISGSVRYVATPLTSVVVMTEASRTRFAQVALRNTDSRQMQFGVDLHPRALIWGSARVGYQSFQLRNAGVPDFSGLVGSASLSYRIGASATIGWSFDRSVSYSYLPVEPYYVRDGYGLSFRRQLLPQWDVTVSGEQSWHTYRRSGVGPGVAARGHSDRFLGGTIMIGCDLGPRTRFTTGLSYQNRQSDFDGRSYDGFRLGTSVVYGF